MAQNHLPEKAHRTIATLSNERLLSVYGPVNCLKHAAKLRTISHAINTCAPTLAALQRDKGRDFALGLTMGWLMYLNDLLRLNKCMSEDQIELCAHEINDAYPALKMSDLAFLFRRIISGQYGEFYESLSIAKVLGFFREYFDERCLAAAEDSQRAHADFSSLNDAFNSSRNVKRWWQGKSSRFL